MAPSVSARSRCSNVAPGPSGRPSAKKIFVVAGQRARRDCDRGSESAMSFSMGMPSRASAIAGAISWASVNLPEPYFACASASPATVPGTPMASAESCDLRGSASPRSSRKISRVVAAGAVDQHVAAAPDIAGARIGHRQRETGRDRGVDGVAALLENLDADARGARLLRGHHAVARRDRLDARGGYGRGIDDRGRLRRERLEADQACDQRKERVAGEADHRTLQDGHIEDGHIKDGPIKICTSSVTHAPRDGYS